ncbi:hypothetical protein PV325_004596 [Microctonus aethiopoides]|nr:hypothetical protein PV325_004596 [Microctonus aethiopoides]
MSEILQESLFCRGYAYLGSTDDWTWHIRNISSSPLPDIIYQIPPIKDVSKWNPPNHTTTFDSSVLGLAAAVMFCSSCIDHKAVPSTDIQSAGPFTMQPHQVPSRTRGIKLRVDLVEVGILLETRGKLLSAVTVKIIIDVENPNDERTSMRLVEPYFLYKKDPTSSSRREMNEAGRVAAMMGCGGVAVRLDLLR